MCLQQLAPNGPPEDMARAEFPPLERLPDRTLFVHCLMLAPDARGADAYGRPSYRRRGIGTRMARRLIEWAGERGWDAVEATAYVDLDMVYSITGVAGRSFWEALGFEAVETGVEAGFDQNPDILKVIVEQGRARGLSAEDVKAKYTMRRTLP